MISHQHKCIFIHIPKVAGQSIERIFLNDLGLSWNERSPLLLKKNEEGEKPDYLAHLYARDYVRKGYLSNEQFENYFKFSIVRNPWSRTVSFYNYLGYSRLITFEFFVSDILPKLLKEDYAFVSTQYTHVYDENGRLLVDFIGRFENLNNDIQEVMGKLGIKEQALPHVNKGNPFGIVSNIKKDVRRIVNQKNIRKNLNFSSKKKGSYKDYYSNTTKELIEKYYAEDITAFNYEF